MQPKRRSPHRDPAIPLFLFLHGLYCYLLLYIASSSDADLSKCYHTPRGTSRAHVRLSALLRDALRGSSNALRAESRVCVRALVASTLTFESGSTRSALPLTISYPETLGLPHSSTPPPPLLRWRRRRHGWSYRTSSRRRLQRLRPTWARCPLLRPRSTTWPLTMPRRICCTLPTPMAV